LEKVKRNERIGAIIKILSDNPNRLYTLSHFSTLFGAAKSTISEDIMFAREILRKYGLGDLEAVTGAAGGVRYIPLPDKRSSIELVKDVCEKLAKPSRMLQGGYIYMQDILNNPLYVERMGDILAAQFAPLNPDFVVTMETKGIPVALMVARALGRQLVVISKDRKVDEGPSVSMHYFAQSSGGMREMSLSRRAVKEGQKALIIDDFMKGGGTAKGIADMMKEFAVSLVGIGVVIATAKPEKKMIQNYKSLITLEWAGEEGIQLTPASWLGQ
jgi:purine operon repressor